MGVLSLEGYGLRRYRSELHAVLSHYQAILKHFQVLLWGQIELNVAIVCASAASLRPLFGSAFAGSGPRSRSGHAQYRSSRNYGLGSSHFGDTVALSMRKGPETKIEAELHGMQDGDSQELILSHEDGIKRTRETNVTSESAGTHDIHGK